MDLDQLKQILLLVREHGLAEFELEDEGWRLKLRTGVAASASPIQTTTVPPSAGTVSAASGPAALATTLSTVARPPVAEPPEEADIQLAVVKSPIVGTFYRSAEPGGASFVDVGARVKKGQVLCIIEAMKLMNEIDSEYDGEVVSIYVENGQPVQYGERLFAIKTS